MGIIGSIRKHSWIAVAIVGIAIIAFILGDLTKNNSSIPDMGKAQHRDAVDLGETHIRCKKIHVHNLRKGVGTPFRPSVTFTRP